MQDTAGTWLMTALTTSPLLIALMQTAASLPVLLFGLLAGATADIFDRRKLLIFWQAWMLGSVTLLAVFTFLGHISPWALLAFTALLNVGSALNNPAWQAIVPELVPPRAHPRHCLPQRCLQQPRTRRRSRARRPHGSRFQDHPHRRRLCLRPQTPSPLPASSMCSSTGSARPLFKSALPSERIAGSIRGGLRYVRYSPTLQSSLVRAFIFPFFVSAIWSLLAVVAKQDLHRGAIGYGILNGALGVGAVIAATQLPRIRRRFTADQILTAATFYQAFTLFVLAFKIPSPWVIIPTLIVSGSAWTSTMSSINTSVQLAAPPLGHRSRPRHLSYDLPGRHGPRRHPLGLHRRARLHPCLARRLRHRPARHPTLRVPFSASSRAPCQTSPRTSTSGPHPISSLSAPSAADHATPDPHEGPVRISIEYHIPLESYAAFTHRIHLLRGVRLRDGAIRWGIYRDADNPTHLNETFIMESWLDYLRSRERTTAADHAIRESAYCSPPG